MSEDQRQLGIAIGLKLVIDEGQFRGIQSGVIAIWREKTE
jgi:hypothetical protein